MRPIQTISVLAIAGLLVLPAAAQAQEVRYNTFMTPRDVETTAVENFFEELNQVTNGEVTAQVFVGGQVLGPTATLSGIRNGVVDAGFIVPTLNSSELPNVSMLPELLPFAPNFWAAAGATNETMLLNCQGCQEDMNDQNAIWLGGVAASPWHLMCRSEISGFDDIQGKKVRVTGGFATRMINALGGVGVGLAPTEIAPALQSGQVDCAVGPLPWLTSLGLADIVRSIVEEPIGSYHGLGLLIFNRDSFEVLSEDARDAIWNLMPKHIALTEAAYAEKQQAALDAASERGITLWQPDEAFLNAMEEFRAQEQEAVAADIRQLGGSENAEEQVAEHIATLEKWEAFAEEADGDPAKFEEILVREIYSKVER